MITLSVIGKNYKLKQILHNYEFFIFKHRPTVTQKFA